MVVSKEQSLFDVLPADFFQILANGVPRKNYQYLLAIDDFFLMTPLSTDKENLCSYLAKYIKQNYSPEDLSEEDENQPAFNPAAKANQFVNRLIASGWLEKENGKDFSDIVYRTEAFVKLMPVFRELSLGGSSVSEYSGPLLAIYRSVYPFFDSSNAVAMLDQINANYISLQDSLMSINANMKRFVKKQLQKTDISNEEMLDALLNTYRKSAPALALHNLLSKNNPSKYNAAIISSLTSLKESKNRDQVVNDWISLKGKNPNNPDDIAAANAYLDDIVDRVVTGFREINGYIDIIQSRDEQYATTTKDQIKFRLNSYRDIQAEINKALKRIDEVDDQFDYSQAIDLGSFAILDDASAYKPRNLPKKAAESLVLEEIQSDGSADEAAHQFLLEQAKYSHRAVDEFVKKELGDRQRMNASEVPERDGETLIKLLLALMYASSSQSFYRTDQLPGKTFRFNNLQIDDYVIERKEEQHD